MSENKQPEIIVGSAKGRFKLPFVGLSKRTKLVALLALLVIAIGGAFVYLNIANQKDRDKEAFKVAFDKSQVASKTGDNNGIKRAWQDFLNTKPKDKNLKGQAEFYLAQAWYTLGDLDSARENAELSLKHIKKPENIYRFLGDLTKQQKDYKAALSYYQKAMDALEPSLAKNPQLNVEASYLRSNIALMKSQAEQQGSTNAQ